MHTLEVVGLVPDHNKANNTIKWLVIFGGGSCLQFVKNAVSVKYNKIRYAYTYS